MFPKSSLFGSQKIKELRFTEADSVGLEFELLIPNNYVIRCISSSLWAFSFSHVNKVMWGQLIAKIKTSPAKGNLFIKYTHFLISLLEHQLCWHLKSSFQQDRIVSDEITGSNHAWSPCHKAESLVPSWELKGLESVQEAQ